MSESKDEAVVATIRVVDNASGAGQSLLREFTTGHYMDYDTKKWADEIATEDDLVTLPTVYIALDFIEWCKQKRGLKLDIDEMLKNLQQETSEAIIKSESLAMIACWVYITKKKDPKFIGMAKDYIMIIGGEELKKLTEETDGVFDSFGAYSTDDIHEPGDYDIYKTAEIELKEMKEEEEEEEVDIVTYARPSSGTGARVVY